MPLSYLPNLISVLRLILLIPFVNCMLRQDYQTAFYYFFVAGFSDALDGFLARYFNWTSQLGAFLDPLADKLLMFVSFSSLVFTHQIPAWVFLLVVARDIIIVSGVALVLSLGAQVEVKPTLISKLNTTLQIGFVLLKLLSLSFMTIPPWLVTGLLWSMVLTTITSVLQYARVGAYQVLNGRS